MSGIIHGVLSRTVARVAPGSRTLVFVLDGVEHRVRGCRLDIEKRTSQLGAGGYQGDDILDETLQSERRVVVPISSLPRMPADGEEVRETLNGRTKTFFVGATYDKGPVWHVVLTKWRS